jgi:hypothetical protein
MKRLLIVGLVLILSGCGRSPKGPILSGGKPVSYWVDATHSPDVKLRREAVRKLGNINTADETVPMAVFAALKDTDSGVRQEAVRAVYKFGAAAKEAVPTLTELSQFDQSAQVRFAAAEAVKTLQ